MPWNRHPPPLTSAGNEFSRKVLIVKQVGSSSPLRLSSVSSAGVERARGLPPLSNIAFGFLL